MMCSWVHLASQGSVLCRPRARQCRPRALPILAAAEQGQQQRAIVIGAGAGGLATAGRLARAGLAVTVLEKNGEVGGRVQSAAVSLPEGDYRFDTGPSLLLFPDKYREAFEALGTTLEAQGVQLDRVGPAAYRVWFAGNGGGSGSSGGTSGGGSGSSHGSSHLDLLNDEAAMAAQLEGAERGAGEGFRRFLRMARMHLRMGVPYFIDRDFEELANARGLQDLLPFLPELNVLDLLGQHDWRLRQFFADPRLRAMFTFQDLYVGLTPYTAPAVFGLLAGTELTDGVWYPRGGFQRVRDALRRAAEACGAEVQTGAEVAAITTDPAGARVTGVALADGRRLEADLVVCNRDLAAAYQLLEGLPPGALGAGGDASSSSSEPSSSNGSAAGGSGSSQPSSGRSGGGGVPAPQLSPAAAAYGRQQHERLGRLKYSAGVIAYNWCVGRPLEGLQHHNVFLSQQWREAWRPAGAPDQLVRAPNFYLHCPSRTDPSAAPPGCESVMVLLPVAHEAELEGGQQGGYAALVDAGRRRILQTLGEAGLGDVGASIRHERVIAPPDWRARYGLRHGAAFGLAHGLDQLSLFRPANRDKRVAGLYFVGASTRPGNGVPLCFISAKLTAQRVLKDLGRAEAAAAQAGR